MTLADMADVVVKPQAGIVRVDHASLHEHLLRRLAAPGSIALHPDDLQMACFRLFAEQWMRSEEQRAMPQGLPRPADFDFWFMALRKQHRVRSEPLFEHLAASARLDQLATYVCAEAAIERRLPDVIALAQLGLDGDARQVLASHYWEEMGRGHAEEMHPQLFRRSCAHFQKVLDDLPWRSRFAAAADDYMDANLMLLLALERRFALRLLGALTLVEHAAPYRHARLVQGMRRLKVPAEAIYVHEMRIHVCARHGDDLLRRVLRPLVERQPEAIVEIALGMLLQHHVSIDHGLRMAKRLGLA